MAKKAQKAPETTETAAPNVEGATATPATPADETAAALAGEESPQDQYVEHDDEDGEEFSDLTDLFGPKDKVDAQTAEPASEPVPSDDGEAEPAPDTGEATPAEPAAPEEPAVQAEPQSTEEPAAQPVPETPPEPPIEPQQVLEQYNQWRQQAMDVLEKEHYNLTEEQAELLENEPAKFMSKLAATLHVEILQQATAAVMRVVPSLMQQVQTMQQDQSAKEEVFFQQWPQLREYRDDVFRHGQAYHQTNPAATFEDFVRDVGAIVSVARQVVVAPPAGGNGEVVTPPAPVPPKPLGAAGGARPTTPATNRNPFAQLDQDFESFEEDYS